MCYSSVQRSRWPDVCDRSAQRRHAALQSVVALDSRCETAGRAQLSHHPQDPRDAIPRQALQRRHVIGLNDISRGCIDSVLGESHRQVARVAELNTINDDRPGLLLLDQPATAYTYGRTHTSDTRTMINRADAPDDPTR